VCARQKKGVWDLIVVSVKSYDTNSSQVQCALYFSWKER